MKHDEHCEYGRRRDAYQPPRLDCNCASRAYRRVILEEQAALKTESQGGE